MQDSIFMKNRILKIIPLDITNAKLSRNYLISKLRIFKTQLVWSFVYPNFHVILFLSMWCCNCIIFSNAIWMFIEPISNSLSLSLSPCNIFSVFLKPQQSTPGNNESSQVVTTKEKNPNVPGCNSENVSIT